MKQKPHIINRNIKICQNKMAASAKSTDAKTAIPQTTYFNSKPALFTSRELPPTKTVNLPGSALRLLF